jgi:hypothetical protein
MPHYNNSDQPYTFTYLRKFAQTIGLTVQSVAQWALIFSILITILLLTLEI